MLNSNIKLKVVQALKKLCENAVFFTGKASFRSNNFFKEQMITANDKSLSFFNVFDSFTMSV